MSVWAWRVYFGCAALFVAAAVALPSGLVTARLAAEAALGVFTVFAVIVGLVVHEARHRVGWLLLTGAVLAVAESEALRLSTDIAGVDVARPAACGLAALGLLALGRRRGASTSFADAALLGVTGGATAWAFLVQPYADDVDELIRTGVPVLASALLLAAASVHLPGRGRVNGAWRLVGLGVGALFACEITRFSLDRAGLHVPGDAIDAGWLVLGACLGAVALHPGAHGAPPPTPALPATRLLLLIAGILAAPAALVWDTARGNGERAQVLAVACGAGCVLLLFRMLHVVGTLANRERTLRLRASFDSLTGLANRGQFESRATAALDAGRAVAVLLVNVDSFKTVNDSLGPDVGDQLLKVIANRLCAVAGADHRVARVGGDEFAVLIHGEADDAARTARAIVESCGHEITLRGHEVFLTVGIGIALAYEDGYDGGALLRSAESAMHTAKETGRNQFQFASREANVKATARLALETNLHRALERREFLLHYQPQFDLGTGHLVGVEALVRWQHPDLGLLLPQAFLALAEDTGVIVPLGEWVLGTACRQVRSWELAGYPPLRLAVNVSALEIPGMLRLVAGVVHSSGISPAALDMELSETTSARATEGTAEVLSDLRTVGVQVSLDGFGAGASNLADLRSIAVDRLKIDRSFVHGLTSNPDDAAIVKTVIAMAHSLKLRVAADGVETVEELEFLRMHGCHEVQGYLVGRPMSALEFQHFLATNPALAEPPRWAEPSRA